MRAPDVAGTTPRPDSIMPLPPTMVPTTSTIASPTPPVPPVDVDRLLARADARVGELLRAERAEWATHHPPLAGSRTS